MLPTTLLALLVFPCFQDAVPNPPTILLTGCRSDDELQAFAAQLGWLREQIDAESQAATERCAALGADAVLAIAKAGPVGRVLAARALGLAVRFTDAPPEVWQSLARACRDEARCVRAEALRQLCQVRPTAAKLGRQARAALVTIEELDVGDEEMLRLARSGRERLQALLQELKTKSESDTEGDAKRGSRQSDPPIGPPAAPGDAALPALQGPRKYANESAAIATLKNLTSSQAQAQACGVIDTDGDGRGEYGFFRELSGAVNVRGDEQGGLSEKRITPPVLSGAFGNVKQGVVVRSGYCFAIFLPGKDGRWLGEGDQADTPRAVDANEAEVRWCAYAWPLEWGKSGTRVFFVNHTGDVLGTDNAATRYQGLELRPDPEAAANPSAQPAAAAAVNALGRDGSRWVVIG